MIWTILTFSIIVIFLIFLILKWRYSFQLNKLRRKYNEEENFSRRESSIGRQPATRGYEPRDRESESSKPDTTGTELSEKPGILSDASIISNGKEQSSSIRDNELSKGNTDGNKRNKKSLRKLFKRRRK